MTETGGEKSGRPRRRRASRRQMAIRELKIVELMAGGVSVREIALRERLSERRVREIVAHALARRERVAGPEFFELQVRRLSEALFVSYGSMSDGNLKAVDRVVKIVRELDRYHGFAPIDGAPLRGIKAAPPLALEAAAAPIATAQICGQIPVGPSR
jgi:DNA-binding CsgD family transcriptional regulator